MRIRTPIAAPRGLPGGTSRLRGKRVAMVVFSYYLMDPRPRRAAEALRNEGMHVDVICLKGGKGDPKPETFSGVDVLRIPLQRRRTGAFGYVFQYVAFVLACAGILAVRSLTRRYDLVYVHNMPDILVLSALIPKAFGAKVILDLHDPMPELMMTIFNLDRDSLWVRTLKRLEKLSIERADLALTVNLACKKLFVSRGSRPEKIRVVMNSPDDEIFVFQPPRFEAPAGHASRRPFVIMYHGSLVERNGVDLAVDAIARVRESVPSVELRIYGSETKFLERVMETVHAKGLTEVVRYLGPRRIEDIAKAIVECDLGIIPNRRNVFTELNTPTRIFEYLSLGKPVIAPRAAGIQDYFDDDSLIFFELGDAEDLARKIKEAFFRPGKAVELVKRGQAVYLAHTWPEERQTLVNLTSELLTRGSRVASFRRIP